MNIPEELVNYSLPDINKARASDEDFIADLVDVGNLICLLLKITAALVPNIKLEKLQQGVLFGHMVRIFKLYDGFLLLISERRTEMAFLGARALTETSIILKYLTHHIDDELCEKFIKSSLAYDKKLLELVQGKISGREPLPFEKRIIESIEKSFSETNFKLGDIQFNTDKEWHLNLFDLATKVKLVDYYESMYRICSGAEHGSWHHLKYYNLVENEAGYESELNNAIAHPQLIIATNLICIGSMYEYLKYTQPNEEVFDPIIKNLIEWHLELSKKRDIFISDRTE